MTTTDCTDNFGLIVAHFYKLGPTNIVSPTDSDALQGSVYINCNSTSLCSTSVDFSVVATEVTSGTISIDENTNTIYTTQQYLTIEGAGFDPYTASNNYISFTHNNNDTCGTMMGTVSTSTRTHVVVEIHKMSPTFRGDVSVSGVTISGVVNETTGVGENLLYAGASVVISNLDVVAPTLISNTSAILSSDTTHLTITGLGFDNSAVDDDGYYTTQTLSFTSAQESYPVTIDTSISTVTRSTLVVSFYKLNARNVGYLNYTVTLYPMQTGCSEVINNNQYTSDSAVAAEVVASLPDITIMVDNREEIDSESETMTITVYGKGFDSEPSYNTLYQLLYEGEDDPTTLWDPNDGFSGVAASATRTQLTFTLGPIVDISNAGNVFGTVSVAEFDGTLKTPCALKDYIAACDASASTLIAECDSSDTSCDSALSDGTSLPFIIKIGKGTPTLAGSTSTIRSDATCLKVEGTNFAATTNTLSQNTCMQNADNFTCNTNTTEDLETYTSNCTVLCDKAYQLYRDYTYPASYDDDLTEEYACSPWGFTFDASSTFDIQYVDFSSSDNSGT